MRLRDIGIEPFKIAAALKGVVAQRLLRRVCPECKAKGCRKCSFTGYRGRFAVQEIMTVDSGVAELIAAGVTMDRLSQAAQQAGMVRLWEAGMRRVRNGDTTPAELERVIGSPSEASKREAADAVQPVDPLREPLVLVADDDAGTRLLSASALSVAGFRTAEAEDGLAALESVQRLQPDLLLLDMVMPRLDGLGVLGALRSRLGGRSLPIIVLTSNDDGETERRCLELGADDFLVKPADAPNLVARVQAVLRRTGRA